MIDRRFDPAAVRLTDGTYNRPSDYGRPLTAVRAWTYDGGKYCATCAVRRHGRHALVDGRALDKSDKSVGALFAVRPSDTCERCGRNLGGVA